MIKVDDLLWKNFLKQLNTKYLTGSRFAEKREERKTITKYPVLIIAGKYDKVYLAEEQLIVASQIPNAQVLLLHHSGHMGFMEEEELVIEKITEFLNEKIS